MKNLYKTTVAVLFAGLAFAQNGNFVNGGFENWTTENLFDYPTEWVNANTLAEYQGVYTVEKSTDAQDGSFATLLTAEIADQDTVFGYVLHGDLDGVNEKGIPYTDLFNEVRVYYKSDLPAGDALNLVMFRYFGGSAVEQVVIPVATGVTSAYTEATIPVTATAQDSLFIGFVLGNPVTEVAPSPDAWALIDNVRLFNNGSQVTNLPDHSFENWTTVSSEDPDNWSTINEFISFTGMNGVTKTTDANTGSFAAQLETLEDPTTPGTGVGAFMSVGNIDFNLNDPFEKIPYNASPTTFSAAYKYAPVAQDEAELALIFYAGGVPVGNYAVNLSGTPGPGYETINAPLTITGTPDSMQFVVFSGDSIGSILKLDDLMLSGGNVGLDEFSTMDVSIYPNPATETVFIKADGTYDFRVLDVAGNTVHADKNINGATELTVNQLTSGAYFVEITDGISTQTHKLIKE